MIYYCARCGKPIPRGKEMMEKIGGRLVPTHMDCRERYSKKTLDQMIHEALDKGPGNELRRKMRGRNDLERNRRIHRQKDQGNQKGNRM